MRLDDAHGVHDLQCSFVSAQVSAGIVIAVRGSDSQGDVIAEAESRVPEVPCLEHNRHERRAFKEARSLSCCGLQLWLLRPCVCCGEMPIGLNAVEDNRPIAGHRHPP